MARHGGMKTEKNLVVDDNDEVADANSNATGIKTISRGNVPTMKDEEEEKKQGNKVKVNCSVLKRTIMIPSFSLLLSSSSSKVEDG